MKLLRLFFVAFSLMFSASNISAQKVNTPILTGEFKEMQVEQFLIQLEKQTGYHFYYDTATLDSFKINISVKDQPLKNVLNLAFEKTNMVYVIDDDDKNIFISKGEIVKSELPPDFFSPKKK